jgi:hypothetical protein
MAQSPCFYLPLLIPLCSPFESPLLTWNPPCCDRIRPPRSQVARKLIFPFPSPCSYTPHSKIPTPRGSPDPNIHSLGRHRETSSQDRAQLGAGVGVGGGGVTFMTFSLCVIHRAKSLKSVKILLIT